MVCRESRLRYTSVDGDTRLAGAMVCRESRLRYTGYARRSGNSYAMVCRESRLRYTTLQFFASCVLLWFAGNRG